MNVKRNSIKFLLSTFMVIGSIGFSINAKASVANCYCTYEFQGYRIPRMDVGTVNSFNKKNLCHNKCGGIYNEFLSGSSANGKRVGTLLKSWVFDDPTINFELQLNYNSVILPLGNTVEEMLCQNFLPVEVAYYSSNEAPFNFNKVPKTVLRQYKLCQGIKK